MKRLYILCLAVLVSIPNFAQIKKNTVRVAEFDSIHFVLPAFQAGYVYFTNGARESGAVNIDALDQKLMFVDTYGQPQVLANNDAVDKVMIGKRIFYFRNTHYIELVSLSDGAVGLGRLNTINLLEEQRKGAFGMISETTSITSMQSINQDGRYYALSQKDAEISFIQKIIPYIYRDGKFTKASRKVVEKAFPDKKAEIDTFLKEHKVNFDDFTDVEELFNALAK